MSQYLVNWSAWQESVGNKFTMATGTIPAGTLGDRMIVVESLYIRNETSLNDLDISFKYAGETEDPIQTVRYKTDPLENAGAQIHYDAAAFNEVAIAGGVTQGNTNLTIDPIGAETDNVFRRWCVLEECNQSGPWPNSGYTGYNEKHSGGSSSSGGHISNVLSAPAGEAQTFTAMHSVTGNRSFTGDPDWADGYSNIQGSNEACDIITDRKDAGGETDYLLIQNVDDTNPTLLVAQAFSSPIAAGPTTNPISGDDTVRTDRSESCDGTNLSDVTDVLLEGVSQDDVVVTDTLITWTTVNKGTPDIGYGTGKTITFVDGVNGNFTRTVELKPKEGRVYGTVSGLPVGASVRSVFDLAEYVAAGGVANGDIYEVDEFDSNGYPITFNDNGTYSIVGLGEEQSLFWTDCLMASNPTGYVVGEVPVYTNLGPVTETLNGTAIASASIAAEATNLQFRGFNFGAVQGKLYFLPDVFNGAEPFKNGSEVEQTVNNWTDSGCDVAAITWGSIPPGTDLAFLFEKAT